jgi:hypothetical protein
VAIGGPRTGMAWWSGKVSLGGLQDIAGAVNKISESVKNIEKNFDSALGLEEKRDDEDGTYDANATILCPAIRLVQCINIGAWLPVY